MKGVKKKYLYSCLPILLTLICHSTFNSNSNSNRHSSSPDKHFIFAHVLPIPQISLPFFLLVRAFSSAEAIVKKITTKLLIVNSNLLSDTVVLIHIIYTTQGWWKVFAPLYHCSNCDRITPHLHLYTSHINFLMYSLQSVKCVCTYTYSKCVHVCILSVCVHSYKRLHAHSLICIGIAVFICDWQWYEKERIHKTRSAWLREYTSIYINFSYLSLFGSSTGSPSRSQSRGYTKFISQHYLYWKRKS